MGGEHAPESTTIIKIIQKKGTLTFIPHTSREFEAHAFYKKNGALDLNEHWMYWEDVQDC